jgi:tRNA 2-thiocytidine biosynthesis protein TtcA
VQVKKMVREWERQYPGRTDNMLRAMAHVVPSHLMDRNLYPFTTITPTGEASAEGDIAFDEEPCATPSAPNRVHLHRPGEPDDDDLED